MLLRAYKLQLTRQVPNVCVCVDDGAKATNELNDT